MKSLLVLALGLISFTATAHAVPYGYTCHQGYEYKTTTQFGKVIFVATGRRCDSRR